MRVLLEGMSGNDVLRWQQFLVGQGYLHDPANGFYGPETSQATVDFQRANDIDVDGWVGNQTMGTAMRYGYAVMVAESDTQDGPGWPANPGVTPMPAPERERVFGRFAFAPAPTPQNPEAIRITDGWDQQNIVMADVPQLARLYPYKVAVHKVVAPQLTSLFQAWEDAGLMPLVLSWGGSWAPRFIRGSRTYLSNHALGTAFDVNAQWNGLGCTPALKGKKGSVRELVSLAVEHGWYWGGWFDRKDGMHFELREVL